MALLHSREQDPLAVRVHQRAGVAVHDGRLCAHGGARWCRGQARLSGSSSHAAPRLWRCAGQQGPRYASVAGLPRPPQHSAHRALYRVVAGQVHGLLALTDMAGLDTGSTRSRGPLAEISLACWQPATQPNPPLPEGRSSPIRWLFLTLGADMARPSRTGGKKSEAKARNASPAKGRKTTKTKPRIAPAATRVKRRSVSDPSKDLKEAREQQAATAEILKVIASSPDDVQPVFEAIVANADRLIGGFSTAVYRFVGGMCHLAAFTPINPAADEMSEKPVPAPDCRHDYFALAQAGETVEIPDTEIQPDVPLTETSAGARLSKPVVFAPDEQGNGDWRHRRQPQEPRPVFSASRRATADFRRPGRDRHRECAAVQRGQAKTAI